MKSYISKHLTYIPKHLYRKLSIAVNDKKLNDHLKTNPKIVPAIISLTTIPERIGLIEKAIKSLLYQSWLPERIILWVDNDVIVDNGLKVLSKNYPIFEIRKCQDVGPHTKLIWSLAEFPDKPIITADDDTLYPFEWFQRLYRSFKRYPKLISAVQAKKIGFFEKSNRRFKPYDEWEEYNEIGINPNILPLGKDGVLYPPGSFHEEVHNIELLKKLCPKADDIWFRAMTLLNNTNCLKLNYFHINYNVIKQTQNNSLYHSNVHERKNDLQLLKVFEHYNLYDKLH